MLPVASPAQEENKAQVHAGRRSQGARLAVGLLEGPPLLWGEFRGGGRGGWGPHVDAKAGCRLGSRVSRMQCTNGQQTGDSEWSAGA